MKRDIRFLVTKCCNYGCYFCHREGMEKISNCKELTVEDYVWLFENYKELTNWEGVTLSGGEPMMYHDVDRLIKELYEKGAEITIVTNGSLLCESKHLSMLRYVKRINVSIHTMDEENYEKITRRKNVFKTVLDNLRLIRSLYNNLEIRLNVTPCKSNGWTIEQLKAIIEFAKTIKASIKCTELFPNTDMHNCIYIEELKEQLKELKYFEVPNDDRTEAFRNENEESIYLAQCTCSKAIKTSSPINFCRETHDLYVHPNATIPLCRLGNEEIDIWEEIEERNAEILKKKMDISMRRVSKEKCNRYLKQIY